MAAGAVTGIVVEGWLVVLFVPLRFGAPAARKLALSLSDMTHNETKRVTIKTSIRGSNARAHLHIFDCRSTTTGSVFDASSDSDSVKI